MPAIHVCSLAKIANVVDKTGASHLVTLITEGTEVPRPAVIAPERHLFLAMHDITEAMEGMVLPSQRHVEDYLDFVEAWERDSPMVVHCFAGISRSTAAAFIGACALNPKMDEEDLALQIREASPTATPNARLVEIGDALLGRQGRMSRAVKRIGRGDFAYEGVPFALHIGPRED
ncbi:tyrosine phosphatase family protein [Microbaculum marinisediminis]|uniref:Tyrosine phosphatase family protein n=1 Tax=Microbaculum marinisediminis TaxID=2931392 RepID=A0AAW5QSW5_9HYPH|nr:tyrosine phosphatase family protein [Microbaculum sp. A6E488]MCT8970282.1 tyrosine phosphatase family protein [Microbaculum sp. A6E488]